MNLPSDISAQDLPNERIIAIDGTSGSGKSTIARGLSTALGLHVLETGSLYRAVTLICIEQQVDVHDEDAVCEVTKSMDFRYENGPFIGARNISSEIRTHEVTILVSHVSVHRKVRELLTQMMRQWIVQHEGGVIEGRDITTVVAPNAQMRLFIDAPEDIRASRRSIDPNDNTEMHTQKEIQKVLAYRDNLDSTRTASPLTKAEGVTQIDTSLYPPEHIISAIADAFNSGEDVSL